MKIAEYVIHSENPGKAIFKTFLPIRKELESWFILFCWRRWRIKSLTMPKAPKRKQLTKILSKIHHLIYYHIKICWIQDTNMNATTATSKRHTEGAATIIQSKHQCCCSTHSSILEFETCAETWTITICAIVASTICTRSQCWPHGNYNQTIWWR